jgi:subtilase family serine protease
VCAASIPADSAWGTGVGTSITVPGVGGPVESARRLTVDALGMVKDKPQQGPDDSFQFGGGGSSAFIGKPFYQGQLPGTGLQLPGIFAVADPETGAIIVQADSSRTSCAVYGGTSLATSIFSAIWALADQAAGESLGQAAPILGPCRCQRCRMGCRSTPGTRTPAAASPSAAPGRIMTPPPFWD